MAPDNSWLAFLRSCGARLTPDGAIDSFGPAQQELQLASEAVALVPLIQLGAIRVSGTDAQEFLQAQLTSELNDVSAVKAGFSGYCTPKGRLLATPLILMNGEDYLLVLPRTLLAKVAARLAKYVLRAKVRIEDTGNDLHLLGLVGPKAATALVDIGEQPPRRPLETARIQRATVTALPENRLLLVCAAADAEQLWVHLATVAGVAGPAAWEMLAVRAGIAEVLPETEEQFLPQMLGLERYGGVSFSKGCYPGQEIVARTEYLGDLKRRLCRGRSPANARAGDAIYAENAGDDAVGVVANAAASPDGGVELLAVLQRDAVTRPLRLGSLSGAQLTLDGVTVNTAAAPEGTR